MNTNAMGRFEERGFDSVVCPKPIRTFKWPTNCYKSEMEDSDVGTDLLDIILSRGGYGAEESNNQIGSSPPYFCGSPPSRAANPLIQDVRFNNDMTQLTSAAPPYSPSSRGGGCVRMKFGFQPAAIRVEGFDCLNRDNRNCSISAVA
ncbi:putative Coatomer gamma-2 subunit / gamma-2 coat protein / gamma-2 COP [Hibiscus syriacus]|uniref:Coatomer gamma-2 subunit / gamma-2 coat protein / gamma-2 COP n=1 Tax=Hibiscus syriacus TaxID=106335 RepID=A0A6A3BLF1_HIBSY|nr:uncharacterized protein LOC120213974 [Hibiscus syriacus]KAE8717454.1 putative Coatomer gamma-2 subunit / gamma-2 coat protein / gamma-2 COP [Hibiscus syriacus]